MRTDCALCGWPIGDEPAAYSLDATVHADCPMPDEEVDE